MKGNAVRYHRTFPTKDMPWPNLPGEDYQIEAGYPTIPLKGPRFV